MSGSLTVAAALLASWGCQGVRATHQAESLPQELAASPLRSAMSLDLSRLSTNRLRNDLVQPGDLLELTVATGVPAADMKQQPVRVDEAGGANVPNVGRIQLAGLELSQAELAIQSESIRRGVYLHPQVTLQNEGRRMYHITVAGAVRNPGVKELPASASDLFAALSASGTLEPDASTIVEVTFPPQPTAEGAPAAPRTVRIDLEQATKTGGDYFLPDGAGVMVLRREPSTVQVVGLVKKPTNIKLPLDREMRLLEAIAEAGGRDMEIADKILITRRAANGQAKVIAASFKEAQRNDRVNLVLGPGDHISIQETPLTFALGTVRSFIRFGFSSAIPGF